MKFCLICGRELEDIDPYNVCYDCGLTEQMEKDEDSWGNNLPGVYGEWENES